jgi:hypothetical protein
MAMLGCQQDENFEGPRATYGLLLGLSFKVNSRARLREPFHHFRGTKNSPDRGSTFVPAANGYGLATNEILGAREMDFGC